MSYYLQLYLAFPLNPILPPICTNRYNVDHRATTYWLSPGASTRLNVWDAFSNLSLSTPVGVKYYIYLLATQSVVCGPAASVLPESWVETQHLRPQNKNMHFDRLLRLYVPSGWTAAITNSILKMRKQMHREGK